MQAFEIDFSSATWICLNLAIKHHLQGHVRQFVAHHGVGQEHAKAVEAVRATYYRIHSWLYVTFPGVSPSFSSSGLGEWFAIVHRAIFNFINSYNLESQQYLDKEYYSRYLAKRVKKES